MLANWFRCSWIFFPFNPWKKNWLRETDHCLSRTAKPSWVKVNVRWTYLLPCKYNKKNFYESSYKFVLSERIICLWNNLLSRNPCSENIIESLFQRVRASTWFTLSIVLCLYHEAMLFQLVWVANYWFTRA